jgi:hypothetical protein
MSSISPVNISQLITLDQEKIRWRMKIAVNSKDDCQAWNLLHIRMVSARFFRMMQQGV